MAMPHCFWRSVIRTDWKGIPLDSGPFWIYSGVCWFSPFGYLNLGYWDLAVELSPAEYSLVQ